MTGIGLEVTREWAIDNWDKHNISAYSLERGVDWLVTDIAELTDNEEDIIIFINND
jgi:hypothetical protein